MLQRVEEWSLKAAKSRKKTQVSLGTEGVCVSAHLIQSSCVQPPGNGLEQGHTGLGLSEQTKRQQATPGCKEDVGRYLHQGDKEPEKGFGQDRSRDFWDLE